MKLNTVGIKREKNRWTMLFYDTLIYLVCWFAVMGAFRQITAASFIYMTVGYGLFMLLRMSLNVYKRIVRYGSVSVFSRLLLADGVAGMLLLIIDCVAGWLWPGKNILFLALICMAAAFIIISQSSRILYCYAFRYAMGKSATARAAKRLLERFAFVDFKSTVAGATLRWVLESQDVVPTYINEIQWIVDKFAIRGQVTSITRMNSGYINRTYRIETLSDSGHIHKYTLQRINTNVFKDVDVLMDNYKLVTETLYGRFRIGDHQKMGAVQAIRPTKDGCSYLNDASGCWRMLTYFDDVYSMDIPDSTETFKDAGYAFGNFIKALADLEPAKIKETIPNFHNTKLRYEDLEKSISKNSEGRVKAVQPEIDFIRQRAHKFGMISEALEKGEIPTRICHNDSNLNNILFDKKTHKPMAIIDLDTVMPSSPLYDFGDSMRIGTNTAKDDEKDLSKVSCNLKMYEGYARGFLKACGDILTEKEKELLPYAALVITMEDGIRFLKDHIDGDIYYNIFYPGQNLDRARTQLKLVEDMEKKLPQITDILQDIYDELGIG